MSLNQTLSNTLSFTKVNPHDFIKMCHLFSMSIKLDSNTPRSISQKPKNNPLGMFICGDGRTERPLWRPAVRTVMLSHQDPTWFLCQPLSQASALWSQTPLREDGLSSSGLSWFLIPRSQALACFWIHFDPPTIFVAYSNYSNRTTSTSAVLKQNHWP